MLGAPFNKAKTLLLVSAAFVGGAATSRVAIAGDGPYDVVRQLARVLVLVENEYVDPVDRSRLLQGAVKGMVSELDPHSEYMPPEDFGIFKADTEGEFGGIGVEVDFRNESVVVIAPIEGSPAERAGILPGDRIVAIDGLSVRGKTMQELVRRMRGKPGSTVVVSVLRGREEKLRHFSLSREVIQVSSVTGKILDGKILYLRIKQFQRGTHDELLTRVGKLREEAGGRFAGVLLDLRNNPGGLVDEASAVADELLPGGTVYTTRHRGVTYDDVRARSGGALSREPAVALVNELSASAAELLAGALQDNARATIVGAPTFGKGSVQTIIDLPGGAGLRLTTMRYYTPNGHAIQAEGIHPNVPVPSPFAKEGSFGILRESDLDHHLTGETEPAERAVKGPVTPPESPESAELHLGMARDIPSDPTGSKDRALAVGYGLLRSASKS